MDELPEHVAENRRHWDATAHEWVAAGERSWDATEPYWGAWQVPDSELGMLPEDMSGMRAIELGCGTGYVSAWMARRGAAVVGIDNSAAQLATAGRLAQQHGIDLTLHHGNAEAVPEPDGSFDFAISEYGAAIWCDPDAWIPEAARLLRPGGRLVFLGNHPLAMVCLPADGAMTSLRLERDYFGLGTLDWRAVEIDPGGMEFNRPLSDWFALFHDSGFTVDDYREPRPPAWVDEDRFAVRIDWARRFPSEQVFKLTRS